MKSDGLTGSDCFCTIYLDPANIGRTKIIRNTQDPVWNYSSILSIFRTNIQIHINVKDRDPRTKTDWSHTRTKRNFQISDWTRPTKF